MRKWGCLMKRSGTTVFCLFLIVGSACTQGCAISTSTKNYSPLTSDAFAKSSSQSENALLVQVGFDQKSLGQPNDITSQTLFSSSKELIVTDLVEKVLFRNPSLAQMTAAQQAASARYPQVTALDDPMFGETIGPASIGSKSVDFGYRLELSQKLPFPGKLGLKGQAALAEVAVAGSEVEDMRLQLIEAAKIAFYDYYLVSRALEVNEENLQRLREVKQNAESRVRNLQAPQQDLLQADVEIGRQQERELLLSRMKEVTIARINTLLHLAPDNTLPPAPKELKITEELLPVVTLRTAAISRRPDLQGLAARIDAEQAALGLAEKEYYPDIELTAAYDAFWQPGEKDLRPQVGMRMNLPVQRGRRNGAVMEAMAKIAQRRAELERLTDQVQYQVQEAYAQVKESEKGVHLYEKTILPAAEANVKEALTAYGTSKVPFLSLVEAQRSLIMLRDRFHETVTDYFRRRAVLERAMGGPLP